eukprot:TRINITY_DN10778_c0_g1_i3.p1 TRINITY_DN10778_c0_g1~~TRINITY_DN10778_c0_g1_i3.p1  ORF type:complete len:320 (-),score=50.07 TRINITY_DN10778_c0_g1_i3:6-965(-)
MCFLGPTLTSQAHFLVGTEILSQLPMESIFTRKLDTPVVDNVTGLVYCGKECKKEAQIVHHVLYSDNPYSKQFLQHAVTHCERFILAAQVIIKLINSMAILGLSKEKAWCPYQNFARGSWIKLLSDQKIGTSEYLSTKEYLTRNLGISHHFLRTLLQYHFISISLLDSHRSWSEYLTQEFYDTVLGIFELNNPHVCIMSPLHQYFEALFMNTSHYSKTQPILAPLVSAINHKYGEIPSSEGHGLFTLHSCINHSCIPNVKQEQRSEITSAEIAIVAMTDITKGDELFICYIHVEGKSKEERRRELEISYDFTCQCKKCK